MESLESDISDILQASGAGHIFAVDKNQQPVARLSEASLARKLVADKQKALTSDYLSTLKTSEEKIEFAKECREQGNIEYYKKNFRVAQLLYEDALLAAALGKSDEKYFAIEDAYALGTEEECLVCSNLVACLLAEGQYARASALAKLLLSKRPTDPLLTYRLGKAEYLQGRDDDAAKTAFTSVIKSVTASEELKELAKKALLLMTEESLISKQRCINMLKGCDYDDTQVENKEQNLSNLFIREIKEVQPRRKLQTLPIERSIVRGVLTSIVEILYLIVVYITFWIKYRISSL